MHVIKSVLALLVTIFFVFDSAIAETKIGREKDGTPFRVDAEGNRISDYIAELEVNSDELRRRVLVLEEKLKKAEKSKIIVKEKKPVVVAKQDAPPCEDLVSPLKKRIEILEGNLAQVQKQTAKVAKPKPSKSLESSLASLKELLEQKDQALEVAKKDVEKVQAEAEEAKKEVRLAKAEAAEAKQEAREKVGLARANVEKSVEEIQLAKAEVERLRRELEAKEEERKAVEVAKQEKQKAQSTIPPKALARLSQGITINKAPSIPQKARSSRLIQRVERVESLAKTRKVLLRRLMNRNPSTPLNARRIGTRDGRSLKQVIAQAKKVTDRKESKKLESELLRLESILRQEIKILEGHLNI